MKANKNALVLAFTFGDINYQLSELFLPGFLQSTPWKWLQHFPRYLRAILARLEKAPQNTQRDKTHIAALEGHWRRHKDHLERMGHARYEEITCWRDYRWMTEELRVSLFAQD
jgi:ATP-dependent helicase HrpA